MWYENSEKRRIDLTKPILCVNNFGHTLVLLPHVVKESYEVEGYNWFDLDDGEYHSCCVFETAEDAIRHYKQYNPVNGTIVCKL